MGPPDPRRQLMHFLGPKVGCQHATVGFIQQQLPTGCRYHQPSSTLGATKDQLKPMQFPNVKASVASLSPTNQLLHFHISISPRGFSNTCKKCQAQLQATTRVQHRVPRGIPHAPFKQRPCAGFNATLRLSATVASTQLPAARAVPQHADIHPTCAGPSCGAPAVTGTRPTCTVAPTNQQPSAASGLPITGGCFIQRCPQT